jgi:hypothetical protein
MVKPQTFGACFSILWATAVFAQGVITVSDASSVVTVKQVTTTKLVVAGVVVASGTTEGTDGAPQSVPLKLITVSAAPTDTINMRFRDRQWNDASRLFTSFAGNRWGVSTKGDYMVEAWVRDSQTGWIKDIDEVRIKVTDGPPDPDPDPDPNPVPPDGPFDGLAARVQAAAVGKPQNAAIGKVFADIAGKMKRFEYLQVSQAKQELTEKLMPYRADYRDLIQMLVDDASGRSLNWFLTIDWYTEIAKGLGVDVPQVSVKFMPPQPLPQFEQTVIQPVMRFEPFRVEPPTVVERDRFFETYQPRPMYPRVLRMPNEMRCVGNT